MSTTYLNNIINYHLDFLNSLETIVNTDNSFQNQFEKFLVKKIHKLSKKYDHLIQDAEKLTDVEAENILNTLSPFINLLYDLNKKISLLPDSELKKETTLLLQKSNRFFLTLEQIADGDMFYKHIVYE